VFPKEAVARLITATNLCPVGVPSSVRFLRRTGVDLSATDWSSQ
jgi:hypothetical protein